MYRKLVKSLLYEPKTGKGFLFYKFKNNRAYATTVATDTQSVSEWALADKNELISFFKTCIIPAQKNDLLKTLDTTISLRTSLLQDSNTNFTEIFHFYFVSPDIVRVLYLIDNFK